MTAPQSNEGKAARQLANALDTFSFKAPVFAYFMCRNHIEVQRRLFQMFLECRGVGEVV